MDLSTKVFGDFCVACALAVIGIVVFATIAVMAWVTYVS